MRVIREQRVGPIQARLSLRRRTKRTHERAGGNPVLALKRVTKIQLVIGRRREVETFGRKKVIERRRRKAAPDRARGEVARPDEHHAVLIAILNRAKEPRAVLFDWPTERERILLAIERRRLAETPIERRR